ncbi:radical SAM protein [Prochlorococcus sp. AH-736-A21]|nr:radical SAM protein [Prochlorococcus sp. AH-736-A21]
MFSRPDKKFSSPPGIYKKVEEKKEYGASNLQFISNSKPLDISLLKKEVLELLNKSKEDNNLSFEDKKLLPDLTENLSEKFYLNFIDLDYKSFSITPHEYDWLHSNSKEKWVDYLLYRYKFKLFPTKKIISKFPVHLCIEPTSLCNLRCIMCFQLDKSFSSNKDFMGFMEWDLFTKVVDQAAENKCHAITLASRGEPTLHKDFGKMLIYIHNKGIMDVKINTNATRLTEKLCHQILQSNIATVTLSVDACNPETYESIRVGGKFNQVLKNIKMFHKIRNQEYKGCQTKTRIAGVAVKDTQSPDEMLKFWSQHVDQVTIRKEIPRWDTYNNKTHDHLGICNLLFERIYVWFDGVCSPCDFDYKAELRFGNANSQTISDIWLGEEYKKIRKFHTDGKRNCLRPCDRCNFGVT